MTSFQGADCGLIDADMRLHTDHDHGIDRLWKPVNQPHVSGLFRAPNSVLSGLGIPSIKASSSGTYGTQSFFVLGVGDNRDMQKILALASINVITLTTCST